MPEQVPADRFAELKPVVVCPDANLFTGLAHVWNEFHTDSPMEHAQPYIDPRDAADLVSRNSANLCFLDVGTNWEEALGVLKALRSIPVPVVALSSTNQPDLILSCLREGASEFLYPPFDLEPFRAAMDRIIRRTHRRGPRRGGEVYCFMPGKGACGGTTVATNLAFQLQELTSEKVLLADLDPLTGTIAFQLKITGSYSFVHALANSSRMDEALWKGLVINYRDVDVLLSPDTPVEMVQDTQDLAALVEYWRKLYAFVVLDIPAPYTAWGLQVARLCDLLMVVTTNELPAIHSTQNAVAYLEHAGVDRGKIRPIVNRYNTDIGLDQQTIETALDLPVYHLLPSDFASIQKALLEGRAVPSNTIIGEGFAQLAQRLTGRGPAPAKKPSLLGGLFSVFGTL